MKKNGAVQGIGMNYCIKAIAVGEPLLKRTRLCISNWRYGPIRSLVLGGRRSLMSAMAVIVNGIVDTLTAHYCIEIGKVKHRPRGGNSNGVTGIQTEEVDARNPVEGHIGTNI